MGPSRKINQKKETKGAGSSRKRSSNLKTRSSSSSGFSVSADRSNSKTKKISKRANIGITHISSCLYRVELKKQTLYLVGTAHVSKASTDLVEEVINTYKPSHIYLELDQQRKETLTQTKFKEIDLIQIIKNKKTAFFIAYLILSIFQKKIAEKTGSPPGGEFKKAIELADQKKIKVVLVDREANTTIKRLWRTMSFWEQIKFLFSFVGIGGEKVLDEDDEIEAIEKLKESDALSKVIEKISKDFPKLKQVVIDERDLFMSEKIIEDYETSIKKKSISKKVSVGVVGAGHLAGMVAFFKKYIDWEKKLTDHFERVSYDKFNFIPPSNCFWKITPWVLTICLIGFFVAGFFMTNDLEKVKDAIVFWVLINGGLSALGGILSLAHPLTILSCFLAAPITSLNPMIGAGMVAALVQTVLVPPQIKDFENFSTEILFFRKWWKNRITKVLLVFVLSALGSAAGTWIAVPMIIQVFI